MKQPEPIYPGVSGSSVITKVTGLIPHNVTFSTSQHGPLMIITPDGELQMPGIKPNSTVMAELVESLIDMFGRSYQSKLLIAEARALAAETLVKTLERRVKDAEDKAKGFEKLAKRGVVDVLAMSPNPKSNRRWAFGHRATDDDMSSDKSRQDAPSGDKDWDDDDKPG